MILNGTEGGSASPTYEGKPDLQAVLEQKFLERTEPLLWSDCLIWTGARSGPGYGSITVGGKTVYAHRLAHELAHGPIPSGMVVDHICHVTLCVNPQHLRLATRQQNAWNRRGRGGALPRGVRRHRSGKFVSHLTVAGKRLHLGMHETADEARRHVTQMRRLHYGEFAGEG